MGISTSNVAGVFVAAGLALVSAQSPSIWVTRDHPAIQYSTRPTSDAIVRFNESVQKGNVPLKFDAPPRGYLESVLKALDIPASSQTLVFSENSLQRAHISQRTPRAIYFNDTVAVAWAKGAETIEATALDRDPGRSFLFDPAKAPVPSRSSSAAMPIACSAICCPKRTACRAS